MPIQRKSEDLCFIQCMERQCWSDLPLPCRKLPLYISPRVHTLYLQWQTRPHLEEHVIVICRTAAKLWQALIGVCRWA